MKRLLLLSLVACLLSLVSSPVFADVPKILKLSEIQPGTEAVGFSVFKGVEPQPFNVVLGEPVDVGGSYLILIKISGRPMETPLEKIGAIAGMSGSPIFVGCRDYNECIKSGILVGALSYSIGSLIEDGMNAAATPIEYMLGAKFENYIAAGLSKRPKKVDMSGWTNLILASGLESGVADKQLPRCSEFTDSDIKPGSMITIFLAKGTMNVGVSGTVTWRDGDKIYAFGHAFMGSGMVNYPFSQISVADTVQSPLRAFKIPGCELSTQGALLVDGAHEVAGVIGRKVQMTPFDVHVFIGGRQISFEESIVPNSPVTSPTLIKTLPLNWAENAVGGLEDMSLAYIVRVVLEGQPEIYGKGLVPVEVSSVPFAQLLDNVESILKTVSENGFPYRLESVHIDVEFDSVDTWKKKDIFLSKKKALPGETIYIHLVLEKQGEADLRFISIPVTVPKDFSRRIKTGEPEAQPTIKLLIRDSVSFVDPRNKNSKTPITIETIIGEINKKLNLQPNIIYIQQDLPRTPEGIEAEKSATQSVEPSPGKWRSIDVNELDRFPVRDRFEVRVDKIVGPAGYILEINESFTIAVDTTQPAQVESKSKKPDRFSFLKFWKWSRTK